MTKILRTTSLWVLVFLALSAFAPRQAESLPTLKLIPDSLNLLPGEEAVVDVILHNPGESSLQGITLEAIPQMGLQAKLLPASVQSLAPGSDLHWQITVTRFSQEQQVRTLQLRVRYTVSGSQTGEQFIYQGLNVQPVGLLPASEVATLEVQSAIQSLLEQRKGLVYLVVENKLDIPITLQPPTAYGPSFVSFAGLPAGEITLAPRDRTTLPIAVSVSDSVQPGKHLLFFTLPLSFTRGTFQQQLHLTASTEVDVGVLGESDILKLLQIPSFLLLPGFLAVVTVGLWWKLFKPEGQKEKFPLKLKSEYFWLVAISISIVQALVYPPLTEWLLKDRRNYLYGYGLQDVVLAWVMGIGSGLLYSLLSAGGNLVKGWSRTRRQSRFIPNARDDLLSLLPKLQRNGLGLFLEQATLKDEPGKVFFLLQTHDPPLSQIWVSPAIEIAFDDSIATATERDISQQMGFNSNLPELNRLLKQAIENEEVKVVTPPAPRLVPMSAVTLQNSRDAFIQVT